MTVENENVVDNDVAPDLLDMFAQNMEAEESVEETGDAEDTDEEVGPESEDEGELAEDSDGDLDEETTDEDDEGEETDEDEEGEGEPEAEAEETPAEPSPTEARLAELEAQFAQSQQQNAQLLLILQSQLEAKPAPVSPTEPPRFTEEVVRAALFGGDDKFLEGMSPTDRVSMQEFANDWAKKQSRLALNPTLIYDDIRERVLADIREEITPVKNDYLDNKAAKAMTGMLKGVDLDADKARLGELFRKQPGAKSPDFETQRLAFQTAVQELRFEKREAALVERERKVTSKKRQDDANRKAKRRNGRGGGRQARRKAPKTPQFSGNLLELYEGIKARELDPEG